MKVKTDDVEVEIKTRKLVALSSPSEQDHEGVHTARRVKEGTAYNGLWARRRSKVENVFPSGHASFAWSAASAKREMFLNHAIAIDVA
uniref:Uncharacterized protein n=1 Tax=Peronospora matthiolae TaxID=2874970 RepID=A0AAV1UJV1_9STRA